MAQELILKGRVRVNGEKAKKPSRKIRFDDVLVFPKERQIYAIKIIKLPERRISASMSQEFYAIIEE